MRKSLLLLPLLCVPFLNSGVDAWAPTSAGEERVGDSRLEEAMGVLKKGQRSLKKLIREPEANAVALTALLAKLEAAVVVALGERPPLPEGLDDKQSALFMVGYKREIAGLLVAVLALESAAIEQDPEALQAGYQALTAAKKSGHEGYRES